VLEFDDRWEGKLPTWLIEKIKKGGELSTKDEAFKEATLLLLKKSMKATQLI
jgi:hypothetical protein